MIFFGKNSGLLLAWQDINATREDEEILRNVGVPFRDMKLIDL